MTNTLSHTPNKVLLVNIIDIRFGNFWPYDDGSPWWSGGTSPRPYQWEIDVTVTTQNHSSNLTREDFEYNGLDIFSRNWITSATSPNNSLEIIEVVAKTETTATILVEDKFRYNTFLDSTQTGTGIFSTGSAVIFSLSEDGMPKLDPLPAAIDTFSFSPNTSGRFRKFDLEQRIQFKQPAHGFIQGDVIAYESGVGFALATSTNSSKSIGRIAESGPGPDCFSVKSFSEILYLDQPNLPGNPGDFLYVDAITPGKYSTTESGSPVALLLANSISTTSTGTEAAPTVTIGHEMSINGVSVTFTGTSLTSAISDINGESGNTYVTAAPVLANTIATTSIGNTAFGGVFAGVTTPATATINGTLVTFNNDTANPGTFGDATDVAQDINDASVPNIIASESGGLVTITNTIGGAITIVNTSPDDFGNNFAGLTSISGLDLSTPASTDQYLFLENTDGTGIILQTVIGTPLADLGIVSTDNGSPAIGMSSAGGIRQASVTVVADITARNALIPAIGDQAFVLDSNDGSGNDVGEWSNWLWDGSQWVMTTNLDSSTTDAKSFEIDIAFNDSSPIDLFVLSDGRRIVNVSVDVTTSFDDVAATLSIGDTVDSNRLMDSNMNDLQNVLDTYYSYPDFVYANGSDVTLQATLNSGTSTQGNTTVIITYV